MGNQSSTKRTAERDGFGIKNLIYTTAAIAHKVSADNSSTSTNTIDIGKEVNPEELRGMNDDEDDCRYRSP